MANYTDGLSQACSSTIPNSIENFIQAYQGKTEALIPVLQGIQERLGYLPPAVLEEVARTLKLPLSRVYGVATFYAQFSLQPKGKHIVKVCFGTACHVRGAAQVLEELQRNSEKNAVTVEVVRCLGACALAPVVVLGGRYYGKMTPAKVTRVLRALEAKGGEAPASA